MDTKGVVLSALCRISMTQGICQVSRQIGKRNSMASSAQWVGFRSEDTAIKMRDDVSM